MGHWFWGEMMGPDLMDGWGPGMMMGRRFNDERLNALKDELAITEAQKKLWDDYVAAVKNAVTAVRGVHVTMMNGDVPATLPEPIKLHEGIMSGRFDAMKSTDAATLALYNGLDDAQKKKADELILGMGMMSPGRQGQSSGWPVAGSTACIIALYPTAIPFQISPLYGRPGNAVGNFLPARIIAMGFESLVEGGPENILGVIGQMRSHGAGQVGIRCIGHGFSSHPLAALCYLSLRLWPRSLILIKQG
jgi:hypothetical protein